MSDWNMPPGVSTSDIPGNEPEGDGATQMLIASLERDREALLAALREAGDYRIEDIRALAAAARDQGSLLGWQKEAVASMLQHYARFLRVSRAAIERIDQ